MYNCCKSCEMDFYIGGGCFGCPNYELENEISNEQAIRILETKKMQPSTDYQLAKVYDMAIKALKEKK